MESMLKVTYSNDMNGVSDFVAGSTTVKEFFSAHGISSNDLITANGIAVKDFDTPLSDYTDGRDVVDIISVAKLQNA